MDHKYFDREPFGIDACLICGGINESLPTNCPGKEMELAQEKRIARGKIDFIDGQWIKKGE